MNLNAANQLLRHPLRWPSEPSAHLVEGWRFSPRLHDQHHDHTAVCESPPSPPRASSHHLIGTGATTLATRREYRPHVRGGELSKTFGDKLEKEIAGTKTTQICATRIGASCRSCLGRYSFSHREQSQSLEQLERTGAFLAMDATTRTRSSRPGSCTPAASSPRPVDADNVYITLSARGFAPTSTSFRASDERPSRSSRRPGPPASSCPSHRREAHGGSHPSRPWSTSSISHHGQALGLDGGIPYRRPLAARRQNLVESNLPGLRRHNRGHTQRDGVMISTRCRRKDRRGRHPGDVGKKDDLERRNREL